MDKLTLTKNNVKIELENIDDKVIVRYEFKNAKEDLEDYLYLLEKIEKYLKSGEFEIEKESS